jgi:hypothetical protein
MKYINKHIYIMILYFNLIYSIFDMNYESKNFDCEMCKYDFFLKKKSCIHPKKIPLLVLNEMN